MKTLRVIKDATLAVTAIAFVMGAVLSFYFQTSFLTVTSRSMEPTINAGDMVLTRQIPAKEIRTRDVVILPVPDAPGFNYSHRVVRDNQIEH